MKKILILMYCITFHANMFGQILRPVKWSYAVKKISEKEAIVLIKATIDKGWHVYSTKQKDGGPVKTTVVFSKSTAYALMGNVTEPRPIIKLEPAFGIYVRYFETTVVFQQKIKLEEGYAVINGKVNFMACNDQKCLPPEDVEFTIQLNNHYNDVKNGTI